MSAAARIIDANANRAREALRVMEDVARFALNDEPLTRELKSIRHELREQLTVLPPGWMEVNRDTPGDVGTTIKERAEREREGLPEVAIAAGKRLSEALRVLEEVTKTISGDLSGTIERLRYRAYAAESRLHKLLGGGARRQWRLCVLLTESLCRHPWKDVLRAVLDAGADCVQVREKSFDSGALQERVRAVIDTARPAGVSVVVNDRVDIALAAGADGVHLGVNDLSIADARRLTGRTLLIGASTHDPDEADHAVNGGADYCGVGTMFPSALKPERDTAGTDYLRQYLDRYSHVPHLAIGGITLENIDALIEAGARGVAVSSAICGADDPGAVARALLEKLTAVQRSASSVVPAGGAGRALRR